VLARDLVVRLGSLDFCRQSGRLSTKEGPLNGVGDAGRLAVAVLPFVLRSIDPAGLILGRMDDCRFRQDKIGHHFR